MREISLTQGKVALVDDDDFERVNAFKWYARKSSTGPWYALRNVRQEDGRRVSQFLHRFILGEPPVGMEIDHKSCDGLDNRKENLRWATRSDNIKNLRGRSDNKSGFKGVRRRKRGRYEKWEAQIGINGKYKWLGAYDTAEEAAKAYDRAASALHGEFARPNFS